VRTPQALSTGNITDISSVQGPAYTNPCITVVVENDKVRVPATTAGFVSGVKIYEHTSTLLDTKYHSKNIYLFI
jgi:hypothetical protein